MSVSRSGGPGGQNVNKVNTRVTVSLDLAATPSLTPDEKTRVRTKLRSRVSATGVLKVTASRHRTQKQNRDAAIERLYELLAFALASPRPRRKTSVPRSQRRQRLETKRARSETKRRRQGDWRE